MTDEAPPRDRTRSRLQLALFGAAVLVAGVLGWLISELLMPSGGTGIVAKMQTIAAPSIGGPFTLTDDHGQTRTDADFRGKLMLVYFGYTHCPDACPTALQDMADALAQLGPAADQIAPVFITIDPARDTADYLKGYAEQFDPRFVSLTGTADQVGAAARAYRVYFKKGDDKPDYLMEHTSIVYLMGRDGRFLTHFTHEATPQQMTDTIRKYLG